MPPDHDPSLRHQLIQARASIVAQIYALKYEVSSSGYAHPGGVADNVPLITEFESQLREIDALLGADETGPGREDDSATARRSPLSPSAPAGYTCSPEPWRQ